MNKIRLQKLDELLSNTDPDKFTMDVWIRITKNGCGTVGYACGLATQDPWFQEQGLHTREDTIEFNGHMGFVAVSRFFGLAPSETRNLFDPSYYPSTPTIDDVRRRIKKVMDKYDPTD